jgi:hypothetical protein
VNRVDIPLQQEDKLFPMTEVESQGTNSGCCGEVCRSVLSAQRIAW